MTRIRSLHPNSKNPEERFLEAFDEYGDALFRHAFLRLSDRERAIELVHDTFTKVWMYVKGGQEVKSFRPFLYKVLNNLIIDEYRRKKSTSLDALFEKEGIDEAMFDDLKDDSVQSLLAEMDGALAFSLVDKIPDMYREVLILRFVDQLGPKEISQLIEISENIVSVRLHRGLRILKELIENSTPKQKQKKKPAQ